MARLVLLFATLGAGAAAAQCGACFVESLLSLKNGASNVPTNLVIHVRGAAPTASEYALRDAQGVELPLRFSSGPGRLLWSLAPESPLSPQTRYELTTTRGVLRFSTGDGEDRVAPEAPTLNKVTHARAPPGPCGSFESWTLDLSGGADDTTPRDQLLLLLQTSHSDEPADARAVTTLSQLTLNSGCDAFSPPERPSFPLAVQVMDLAGNVSVLSAEKRAPSCSTSPAGALVVLACAGLRRRRRRHLPFPPSRAFAARDGAHV